MLSSILPKLPMRHVDQTRVWYQHNLEFEVLGDYGNYLIMGKGGLEIHFFEFTALNPAENYGQVYIRTQDIRSYYQQLLDRQVPIHPNGALAEKPWGQIEFSLLDPDHNLLTFGQSTGR